MKNKKHRLLLLLPIMILLSCGVSSVDDNQPLYSDLDPVKFEKGDVIFPFEYINPSETGWKVVVEISGDDLNELSTRVPGTRLSSADPVILRKVKAWRFVYTGGDLATVTSSILIYKDRELVDQQGIVLDKNLVGLQSIKYGWIIPESEDDVYQTIAEMDRGRF